MRQSRANASSQVEGKQELSLKNEEKFQLKSENFHQVEFPLSFCLMKLTHGKVRLIPDRVS